MTAAALAFPAPAALPVPAPEGTPLVALSGLGGLRAQLQAVVAGGRVAGSPWATGIAALDATLGGGIPRGRITEVVGTRAVGKTALLRQVVMRVLRTGGWVAWIDARRTLAAAPWAGLGDRLVMVRPHSGKRSAWCADMLLRSGVFSLVVIDGAPALSRVHGVRLAQLARERDAACVVLQDAGVASRVSGAVRLRLESVPAARQRHGTRGFSVVVEKGGSQRNVRSIEVDSGIVMARRVCTDSEIPDRRGVARGTRRPWAPVGGSADTADGQPITWGGLGVGTAPQAHAATRVDPIYGAQNTTTHRDPTRTGVVGTDHGTRAPHEHEGAHEPPRERHSERDAQRDRERFNREFDKHTRDWTKYRGRRRAAESSFGRPSRRERARERVGAAIGQQSGQGGPRHSAPRLGRDNRTDGRTDGRTDSRTDTSIHATPQTRYAHPSAAGATALGRVAEGARR